MPLGRGRLCHHRPAGGRYGAEHRPNGAATQTGRQAGAAQRRRGKDTPRSGAPVPLAGARGDGLTGWVEGEAGRLQGGADARAQAVALRVQPASLIRAGAFATILKSTCSDMRRTTRCAHASAVRRSRRPSKGAAARRVKLTWRGWAIEPSGPVLGAAAASASEPARSDAAADHIGRGPAFCERSRRMMRPLVRIDPIRVERPSLRALNFGRVPCGVRDGGFAADPFDVDLNGDGCAGLLCRTTAQAASEIRWFDQVPGTRTTMRKTLAYEPMRVAGPGDKLARARDPSWAMSSYGAVCPVSERSGSAPSWRRCGSSKGSPTAHVDSRTRGTRRLRRPAEIGSDFAATGNGRRPAW